jgi:hypothetical protein
MDLALAHYRNDIPQLVDQVQHELADIGSPLLPTTHEWFGS